MKMDLWVAFPRMSEAQYLDAPNRLRRMTRDGTTPERDHCKRTHEDLPDSRSARPLKVAGGVKAESSLHTCEVC